MKFDRGWCFLILVVLPVSVISDSQPGFIITASKKIRSGQPYKVNGVLLRMYIGATCNIAVKTESGKDVVTEQMRFVGKTIGEKNSISLTVPAGTPAGDYKLEAVCSGSGAVLRQDVKVEVVPESGVILIQTDKGMYKPGQTVKIRILGLTPQLKPSNTNLDVIALDPNGTRIEQWKNISTGSTGVVRLDFQLAQQLPLGVWKIRASVADGGLMSERNVTVEKYVLPRFSVKFNNMPGKVMAYNSNAAENFAFDVLSQYTYGKPVKGEVKVSITYGDQEDVKQLSKTLLNGKASFSVRLPMSDFRRTYGYFYCRVKPEIKVAATVVEDEIGQEESAEASIGIEAAQYQISFKDISSSYTQEMPYPVQMSVEDFSKTDGVIPNNERAAFSIVVYMNGSNGDKYIRDEFSLPVDDKIFVRKLMIPIIKSDYNYFNLQLQAVLVKNGIMVASTDTQYIYKFISKSNLSIKLFVWEPAVPDPNTQKQLEGQMKSSLEDIKRNQEVTFRAYHRLNTQCFYLLMSKGEIVGSDSVRHQTSGGLSHCDFTVRVGLYAPKLTVIVYAVTSTGEILADSVELTVPDAIKQKATLAFVGPAEVDANTNIKLQVKTDPVKSYVGLTVVDLSTLLLRESNDIDASRVMSELQKLDGTTVKEFSNFKCYCGCLRQKRDVVSGGSGDSSYHVFFDAGVVLLTDATIRKADPINNGGWGGPVFAMEFDMVRKSSSVQGESSGSSNPPSSKKDSETTTRKDFPETWIFEDVYTGANGIYEGQFKTPGTITSWIASAFTVSSEFGLDVAPTGKVKVFRPFFVQLNLPYSVKRGESFALDIYVFNYLKTNIRAEVELAASGQYSTWPIGADQKTVNDLSKAVSRISRTSFVDVESQSSAGVRVWIIPKVLGKIRLNITATFDDKIDRSSQELLVEAEGDTVYKNIGKVAEVSNSEKEITIYLDRGDPSNIVPGSQAVGVNVIGDYMGPSLTNLDRLLRVPCGCGEQNMITFVPNIFVMKYLKSVSRLTLDIKQTSTSNMKIGYQRELNYKHKDGSFSAFGEQDGSGSSWLTAFVIRSFLQADEFIYVDSDVAVKGLRWLLSQYDGKFIREPGRVLHAEMQGGSGQDGLSLTAYVFLTLYEGMAKKILPQKELGDLSNKVSRIQGMMEKTFDDSITFDPRSTMTNFELAIVAYGLALAGSSYTDKVLGVLENRATNTEEGLKFWRASTETYNPYKTINGIQSCWHPPTPSPSEVETASYVILAYIVKKEFSLSLPIVKWLLEQMSEQGAFRSTQDTVMGLQSLAEYSSMTSSELSNINFEITAGGQTKTCAVTSGNKFLLQTIELLPNIDVVTIKAYGTGMAKINTFWRYNVYKSDTDDSDLFEIITNVIPISNDIYDLIIEVKYKGKEKSMMGLIEVKDPSGFQASETDTEKKNKGNISKLEIRAKETSLYVDEFKQDIAQKYEIRSSRSDNVADVKAGHVKVQLYYKPDVTRRTDFELPQVMQLSRCQLDGGDSCPLPIINVGGASATYAGMKLILISLFLAIFGFY